MLFEFVKKLITTGNNYKTEVEIFLFIITTVLIIPLPVKFRNFSTESLYGILSPLENLKNVKPLKHLQKLPNETILIIYENTEFLKSKIKKLKIRTKSFEVSDKNKVGNYLLRIFINNSENSAVLINPLNFNPFSDLLYVAIQIFDAKYTLRNYKFFGNFSLRNSLWQNELFLDLSYVDMDRFLGYLRILSNFHSYYFALYFYVPFKRYLIKSENLVFFIAATIIKESFGANMKKMGPYKITRWFLIHKICPISGLFYYNKEIMPFYIASYAFIDQKLAFLYCVIIYLMNFKKNIVLIKQKIVSSYNN
ncbi:hypothetical protein NUSPORA_00768 [Nucleospora cyclopteri]